MRKVAFGVASLLAMIGLLSIPVDPAHAARLRPPVIAVETGAIELVRSDRARARPRFSRLRFSRARHLGHLHRQHGRHPRDRHHAGHHQDHDRAGHHGRHHNRRGLPLGYLTDEVRAPIFSPPANRFTMVLNARDPLVVHSYFSSWVARCEIAHLSFDSHSGTFLGEDGKRHRCK